LHGVTHGLGVADVEADGGRNPASRANQPHGVLRRRVVREIIHRDLGPAAGERQCDRPADAA